MTKVAAAIIAVFLLSTADVFAQNFSCSYGRAACLDYGDIVCRSTAKCVNANAICFDSFTCDYNGFVCKSEFNDVIDEYNALLGNNRKLVSEFNDLSENFNDLLTDSKIVVDNLTSEVDALERAQTRLGDCVRSVGSLEDAQNCIF